MKPENLSQEQKDKLLWHFRSAITSRIAQWDHELGMERILDEDLDLDMGAIAAGVVDAEDITWSDLLEIIEPE